MLLRCSVPPTWTCAVLPDVLEASSIESMTPFPLASACPLLIAVGSAPARGLWPLLSATAAGCWTLTRYPVTGAPRERGDAQESLKDEAAMAEGVGGWGAKGGAGRVVAEPARPSEAVSVINADDTHGLICGSCMQTAYGHVLLVLSLGSTACGHDLLTATFVTLHAYTHAADSFHAGGKEHRQQDRTRAVTNSQTPQAFRTSIHKSVITTLSATEHMSCHGP